MLKESKAGGGEFDFDTHRQEAIEKYLRVRPIYEQFAYVVRHILDDAIERQSLRIHSIEARAKKIEDFGDKAAKPDEFDPEKPKYPNPLEDITDLAGVRVITFFPQTIADIDNCIREQFDVIESKDHGASLLEEERFGYQSVHYLVKLTQRRTTLPEYDKYQKLKAEIQVRTVLQHAWAEIEHDIQYKSSVTIPTVIKRRLIALAGLIEIADREFQTIQNLDENVRNQSRTLLIENGDLSKVEITPDALQLYLDKRLGPDARITGFGYDWEARTLRHMGFTNLAEIDECIKGYDDDHICRIIYGNRQGQLTRLHCLLLASMGETYISLHPWSKLSWFIESRNSFLKKIESSGITIGNHLPK